MLRLDVDIWTFWTMAIEQRANIKFCFKLGKTFTETHQMMKKVYGDDCLSRSHIHEWFKRFEEGRKALVDDERSGWQEML